MSKREIPMPSRLIALIGKTLIPASMLLSASPAFSQRTTYTEHRQWEVTGFLGGSFVNKMELPTSIIGDSSGSQNVGLRYASGYHLGAKITEHLSDFWGADLEYSFSNQPLRFENLSPELDSLALSHSIHHFSYNISYLPLARGSRLRPYARIGAGTALYYIHDDSKEEALAHGVSLRDSWEFAFNWGGGVKFLAADQVALVFDVKDQVSGIPSYGLPRSARMIDGRFIPGMSTSGLLQNWQLKFGIAYQWDE
jgi:opacity protein-like surface antigen